MQARIPAQEAICALLRKLEELNCDFSLDAATALAPLTVDCINEAVGDRGWLLGVFESFGWDGQRYLRPIDVLAFGSRLKALMFDGLQQKGQGSYATVYKVRLVGPVVLLLRDECVSQRLQRS